MAFSMTVARFIVPCAAKHISMNSNLSLTRVLTLNQVKSYAHRSFFQSSRSAYRGRSLESSLRRVPNVKQKQKAELDFKKYQLIDVARGVVLAYFFCLTLSPEKKIEIWPQYVIDRIQSTYKYFGASIIIAAISACNIFGFLKFLNLTKGNLWVAFGATFTAMIVSGILVKSISQSKGSNKKHFAWILHTIIVGATAASACLLGGLKTHRIANSLVFTLSGFSGFSVFFPRQVEYWLVYPDFFVLLMGLSSILGTFLFSRHLIRTPLYLAWDILLSIYLFRNFRRLGMIAETYSANDSMSYDPINASMSMYFDKVNIINVISMLFGDEKERESLDEEKFNEK